MKTRTKYAILALTAMLVLSLVVCGTLSLPAVAANLVGNPGFETGSLSPWGKWNDASVVSDNQHSGSYALRIGNGPASSEQVVSGLTPSTTYTLSGWTKLGSSASGTITIGVKEYGGDQITAPVTATSYTFKSIDFTTGSTNTTAKIFCYRASGTGYAYCDDFYLDLAAPPPTATTSPPTNTPIAGGSYYVDCSAGSNGNGSQSSPWNNLTSVNNTTFAAGSSLLLKRGTTCSGTLWPKGSGSSGSPNVIDAYGTGDQPHVQATCADNGVYLFNQEYWEIRNLEVSNDCGTTSLTRRGIHIQLEDFGTGTYYRILNNTIHDVAGEPNEDAAKHSGGIRFGVSGSTTQTKFSDAVIEGNTVYSVDRSGFKMGTSWWCRPESDCTGPENYYAWDPFIVRDNTFYDIGGDGITLNYAWGSTVEYNVVYDIQMRSTRCNAGIWVWNADNVTFQHNEAYRVRLINTGCDGSGFDIDYGSDGTIMQYNYSHDNDGGFMLICTPVDYGNVNGTVRYNVSQNDAMDAQPVFELSGYVRGVKIYNNTIYNTGDKGLMVHDWNWNGVPVDVNWNNNIFWNGGGLTYDLLGNHTFDYNIFYGQHPASEPNDAHKITSNPLFVDPGSGGTGIGTVGGYQLQAGSPALQAGKIISNNGGKDYWGNDVPSSSAPDIGAHQYTGSGPTPTPGPTNTPAPPTDTPEPTDTPVPQYMHVGDITMSSSHAGPNYKAHATVTILDAGDQPVGTATVYGEFTGASSSTPSDDTAGDGTVELISPKKKNGGTWTFCVTDVVKSGWTYDDASNVETCDQITAP